MAKLDYLLHAYRLKEEPRAGWLLRGVADPESVAGHSWGTALLCLLFADEAGVDRREAVEIALLHDLAEAEIGDVPSLADESARPMPQDEKARREAEAMARLEATWPGGPARHVHDRWRAYEGRDGAAAVFVRDMNLIDMCLQALVYERDGRYDPEADLPAFARHPHLDEFFASAESRVESAFGRALFDEVATAYRELRDAAPPAAPAGDD